MLNGKQIIWLVSIILVGTGSFMAYKYYSTQPELSMRDECFAGSIDACISLDKINKNIWKILEDTQYKVSEENKLVKEQASKLLSWSSFQ